ncbi:MAG: hypothetical protein CMJ49_08660 [Planctomycetaceae bacterium]|nr:hypothetical protein [Planctomycetaceae bacterium]
MFRSFSILQITCLLIVAAPLAQAEPDDASRIAELQRERDAMTKKAIQLTALVKQLQSRLEKLEAAQQGKGDAPPDRGEPKHKEEQFTIVKTIKNAAPDVTDLRSELAARKSERANAQKRLKAARDRQTKAEQKDRWDSEKRKYVYSSSKTERADAATAVLDLEREARKAESKVGAVEREIKKQQSAREITGVTATGDPVEIRATGRLIDAAAVMKPNQTYKITGKAKTSAGIVKIMFRAAAPVDPKQFENIAKRKNPAANLRNAVLETT